MSARWVRVGIGIALIVLGASRLVGGVADTPLSRLLTGWPGQATAILAVAGGLWLYLQNCST